MGPLYTWPCVCLTILVSIPNRWFGSKFLQHGLCSYDLGKAIGFAKEKSEADPTIVWECSKCRWLCSSISQLPGPGLKLQWCRTCISFTCSSRWYILNWKRAGKFFSSYWTFLKLQKYRQSSHGELICWRLSTMFHKMIESLLQLDHSAEPGWISWWDLWIYHCLRYIAGSDSLSRDRAVHFEPRSVRWVEDIVKKSLNGDALFLHLRAGVLTTAKDYMMLLNISG